MKKDLLFLLSSYYKLISKSETADSAMCELKDAPLPESTQKRVENILRYANYQLILDKSRQSGAYLLN